MALLTFKDKYVVQSSVAVSTTSATFVDDTQASQTFTLAKKQTVLVIYQSYNDYNVSSFPWGRQNAICIDDTDVALQCDSAVVDNYPMRNVCFWVGALPSGEHTIKGRVANNGSGTVSISNRILLIYILNGDEFYYKDSTLETTIYSTSFYDDANASFSVEPSDDCKALCLYSIGNTFVSNSAKEGKKIAIGIGKKWSDNYYAQAEKASGGDNFPASIFTSYALSLTPSSASKKISGGIAANGGNPKFNRRQFGVLLFSDDTLMDVVASTTQVSTTSNSLIDDTKGYVSREIDDDRELLVFAVGTKRHGTTSSTTGKCYGIKTSADKQISKGSVGVYSNLADSAATCWAESLEAGEHTVQGRFSNNYSTDTAKIDARCVVALWLGVGADDIEFPITPASGLGTSLTAKQASHLFALSGAGKGFSSISKAISEANILFPPAHMAGMAKAGDQAHKIPLLATLGLGEQHEGFTLDNLLPVIPAWGAGQAITEGVNIETDIAANAAAGIGVLPADILLSGLLNAVPASGTGKVSIKMSLANSLYFLQLVPAFGAGSSRQVNLDAATNLQIPSFLGEGIFSPSEVLNISDLKILSALGTGNCTTDLTLHNAFKSIPALSAGHVFINNFIAETGIIVSASLGTGVVLSKVKEDLALKILPSLGAGRSQVVSSLSVTNLLVSSVFMSGMAESAGMVYGVFVPAISSAGKGLALNHRILISALIKIISSLGVGQSVNVSTDHAFLLLPNVNLGSSLLSNVNAFTDLKAASAKGAGVSQQVKANIACLLPGISIAGNVLAIPAGVLSVTDLQGFLSCGIGTASTKKLLSIADLAVRPAFVSGESLPAGLNIAAQFKTPTPLAQGLTIPVILSGGLTFVAITALSSGFAGIPQTNIDAEFKLPAVMSLSVTPSGLIVILASCQDRYRAAIKEDPFLSAANKDLFVATLNS